MDIDLAVWMDWHMNRWIIEWMQREKRMHKENHKGNGYRTRWKRNVQKEIGKERQRQIKLHDRNENMMKS